METSKPSPRQGGDAQALEVEIELEHAIAYTTVPNALHYHPNGVNYIHTVSCHVLINVLWQQFCLR